MAEYNNLESIIINKDQFNIKKPWDYFKVTREQMQDVINIFDDKYNMTEEDAETLFNKMFE